MSNYSRNGTSLMSIFNTTKPQIGPVTRYLESGTDIGSKFTLYMHGTREKCSYNVTIDNVKYDLGYFFQKDTFSPVQQLGSYDMAPWNITTGATGMNSNTYWIWPTSSANTNAPGSSDGSYYWFYYTFYYNEDSKSGTIYSACDNISKIYFNNDFIADNNGGWGISNVPSYNVTIKKGLNFLRIAAYNSGYGNLVSSISGYNSSSVNGDNIVYTFSTVGNNTGFISFNRNVTVTILVVGGGGGGGLDGGGGGGGGGIISQTITVTAGTTYNISVGAGGNGAPINWAGNGSNGGDSSFGNYSAKGGGGGGSNRIGSQGQSGGSGGGSGPSGYGGEGTSGQGNNGGQSAGSTNECGSGGGGWSGVGGACGTVNISRNLGPFGNVLIPFRKGGDGANGYSSNITGTQTWYAGGGGGGTFNSASANQDGTGGYPGAGGGGYGGYYENVRNGGVADINASFYGGGGGGHGRAIDFRSGGGNGYQGVVIVSLANSGNNSAGLLVSVVDSNNNNVANTNSNWAYSTSSSFDINPLTFNATAS
jgi:hypothetical protein